MDISAQLELIGGMHYDINEGGRQIKGGKVYVLQEEAMNNDNTVGRTVMTTRCEYDVIEKLKGLPFPAVYHCKGTMIAKGKDKDMTLFIKDIHVPDGHASTNNTAPKPAAKASK